MKEPLIFDVKRGSIDDGEGIRTVIFFKGCPLRCSWCHNPESYEVFPQYLPDGTVIGKLYSIDELVSIVEQDATYYKISGGGVTASGGEPTMFMAYLGELAESLGRRGISCTLETCGYFDMEDFKLQVLPHLDCILYDIKLMDAAQHIRYTGKDNMRILDNLRRLAGEKIKVIPRTPLVPGITDTEDNLYKINDFLQNLGLAGNHVKLKYNGSCSKSVKPFFQHIIQTLRC